MIQRRAIWLFLLAVIWGIAWLAPSFSKPRILSRWIHIASDGRELRGTTVAAEEGRETTGGPEGLGTGLLIEDHFSYVAMTYRHPDGRHFSHGYPNLTVSYGVEHARLSAADGQAAWHVQIREDFLVLSQVMPSGYLVESQDRKLGLLKACFYQGSQAYQPWDCVRTESLDGRATDAYQVVRYRQGKAETIAGPLAMREAHKLEDQLRENTQRNLMLEASRQMGLWQAEFSAATGTPNPVENDYVGIRARFFPR